MIKDIVRTPEMHPLTWRLRDDKQPVWLDEYRGKNGYAGGRKRPLKAWLRTRSSTW
jgi:NADH-quinone oxidoreductase subunit F